MSSHLSIQILEGDAVFQRMTDQELITRWQEIADLHTCLTVFQEPEFVHAWYATANNELPVLVLGYRSERLVGVLALSYSAGKKRICHAGAHQAVYNGWLAEPEISDAFVTRAIEKVFARFSLTQWTWQYLPIGTRVEALNRTANSGKPRGSQVSAYQCPIWHLSDDEFFKRKVRNKRLRNYINRYSKEGNLVLEHVTDPRQTKLLLSHLADWVDFRQGAVNSTMPFRSDPTKQPFYEILSHGSATRVSVLRLDSRPLAIQIDSISKDCLTLCLHGYDPREGQRSPGKILLAMLAEQLREQGVKKIDLTPSDNSWKDSFGSAIEHGHRVVFYRSLWIATVHKIRVYTIDKISTLLRMIGSSPQAARSLWAQLQRLANSIFRRKRKFATFGKSVQITDIVVNSLERESAEPSTIADILNITNNESHETSCLILLDSLKRFERNAVPFASTQGSKLVQLVWFYPPMNSSAVDPPPRLQIQRAKHRRPIEIARESATIVVSYECENLELDKSALRAAIQAATSDKNREVRLVTEKWHRSSIINSKNVYEFMM